MIRAKKHARSKRNQPESDENMETNLEKRITSSVYEPGESARQKNNQVIFCHHLLLQKKIESKEYKLIIYNQEGSKIKSSVFHII